MGTIVALGGMALAGYLATLVVGLIRDRMNRKESK